MKIIQKEKKTFHDDLKKWRYWIKDQQRDQQIQPIFETTGKESPRNEREDGRKIFQQQKSGFFDV